MILIHNTNWPDRFGSAALTAALVGGGRSLEQPAADVEAIDQVVRLALCELISDAVPTSEESFTSVRLAERWRVAARHRWIVDRWLDELTDTRLVRRLPDGTGFSDLTRPTRRQLRESRRQLDAAARRLGYGTGLQELILSSIRQLAPMLREEVSVQSLLYPDGSIDVALDVYGTNLVSGYLNAAAAGALAEQARDVPIGVLELGAGIGATSTVVLAGDVPLKRYVYSDISPYFVELGSSRLPAGQPVTGTVLDIADDLTGQLDAAGLPAGGYDAVLAATMAHNAPDVGVLLGRIRDVLTPGGVVVLIETVRERAQSLTTMPFALSPPADRPTTTLDRRDRRRGTSRTYLTDLEWREELSDAGFQLVHHLPDPTHPLYPLSQRLFVARRPMEKIRDL